MNFLDRRERRAITDELRATILEDLPELADIRNEELRRKIVEAWAYALVETSFPRISAIPGEGNPGMFCLKRGNQADHLRGVARMAVSVADDFAKAFPETTIDRDIILAGGLVHDVGKAWEFDPANHDRWKADPSRTGFPSLRHPVYGAHICITVGLPEEIVHIALGHSHEGELLWRSLECTIVQKADQLWWAIAGASGMLTPESCAVMDQRRIAPRPLRA